MLPDQIYHVYSPEWLKEYPDSERILKQFISICQKSGACPARLSLYRSMSRPDVILFFKYFGLPTSVYKKLGLKSDKDVFLKLLVSFCEKNNSVPTPTDLGITLKNYHFHPTSLNKISKELNVEIKKITHYVNLFKRHLRNSSKHNNGNTLSKKLTIFKDKFNSKTVSVK